MLNNSLESIFEQNNKISAISTPNLILEDVPSRL